MEEIKVGEYVRTKRGIAQITDLVCGQDAYFDTENIFESNDIDFYRNNGIDIYGSFFRDLVVKHSKQLIDLVEFGDILKIKISEEWVEKQDTIKFVVVGQTYTITEIKECLENGLFKIIQILTKEKYKQNCFKVVE